jgi:hypothetical protein
MKHIKHISHLVRVVLAVASSLFGFLLFASSASALVIRPIGDSSPAASPQPAHTMIHVTVTGGMAAWQISLIAVGAALLTATVAVFMDRARAAHREMSVSAA